ncbi:hypothetical protein AB0G60_09550 [Streptomyces angustmyceticus]|uniref:Uncharacterized protein n=1 Tax=Streptomyces angustmyceticus TaxID=285578 RepID=A0A5J4LHM9_9ACTN|nr:hypothetical protein [Streptomyces angustmyceticus]GES31046.1 hypothetical protein San01_35330 [Streptomyces angustmyceticus]
MSAIRLLVLGAVRRRGRAHGYQVRGDLDYGGDRAWSRAGPGSVYHALREWRRGVAAYGTPGEASGHLGEVMDLWLHAADSDAAWTRGLIERIAGGAYVFAGEGEPRAPVPGEGPEHPDTAKGAAPRETAGPANDTLQAGPANGAP